MTENQWIEQEMGKMDDRYFIVCYMANETTRGEVHGNQSHITHEGKYLNQQTLLEDIQQRCHYSITNVVITNIIELSEKDLKEWER